MISKEIKATEYEKSKWDKMRFHLYADLLILNDLLYCLYKKFGEEMKISRNERTIMDYAFYVLYCRI